MNRNQLQKLLEYDSSTGIFTSNETGNVIGLIGKDGHVGIHIDGVKYKACDLAWLYVCWSWPEYPIIHRDGVKSNNWFDNLKVPRKILKSNNKLGIPGVSFDKKNKKFRAQICINGKRDNLGSYYIFEQAVLARSKAEPEGGLARQYIDKMSKKDWERILKDTPETTLPSNNTSGVLGVSFDNRSKKWKAQITINGEYKNLGNYKKFEQAVLARSKVEPEGGLAQQYIKEMFFVKKTLDTII